MVSVSTKLINRFNIRLWRLSKKSLEIFKVISPKSDLTLLFPYR
ncbi:hypothetical protein QMU_3407 [Clostridioides difficile DA00310]|nr:hypothetical protein QAS_3715 [Clostridioides difficile CD9]EQE28743.1 hypothetical protein QC5_3479 [Clostridioides difficile CD34]EQE31845.1 hypothetical protein QC7_3597 [Clostridioides difficile CD38]EQE72704.1 hypothetical protein QCQ_3635 [Clostridioides difficile CD49]EQH01218.1 hypothetical protein QKI_0386 [Clostridioides difficile DA00189]EQH26568.1 hypothetical protein QM3_3423 [Clostridioides difficile DA00215]EQH45886.1 hypothetical protein QME_3411 [Clostridioides difficile D